MLAARFYEPRQDVELREVAVPEPGPLEVLVKVRACGICLSDVHLIDGSIPPVAQPVTPGHEPFGIVAKIGDQVVGWVAGARVALMGGRNCGKCSNCTSGRMESCLAPQIMGFHYDGAWAEYIVVPSYTLTEVPEGIPEEEAAILADAVATPYAALSERAALRPGESIGLWGIGGLGTHAVQIARLLGAGLIVAVDPLASARARALSLGADIALDPASDDIVGEITGLTHGRKLDVAVDLVGANAVMKQAVASLGIRGRAVMVGLSVDPLQLGPGILLGVQSQSILGHLGYQKKHLDDLVKLLAGGRLHLSASISEVMPLEEVNRGVKTLAEKQGDPVRLIVRP
jgi:2-desacetyl-2-hydroxyethyl bacteriochlorophyllide A dehydrogenase